MLLVEAMAGDRMAELGKASLVEEALRVAAAELSEIERLMHVSIYKLLFIMSLALQASSKFEYACRVAQA